jgi:hypothetical protein
MRRQRLGQPTFFNPTTWHPGVVVSRRANGAITLWAFDQRRLVETTLTYESPACGTAVLIPRICGFLDGNKAVVWRKTETTGARCTFDLVPIECGAFHGRD